MVAAAKDVHEVFEARVAPEALVEVVKPEDPKPDEHDGDQGPQEKLAQTLFQDAAVEYGKGEQIGGAEEHKVEEEDEPETVGKHPGDGPHYLGVIAECAYFAEEGHEIRLWQELL